MHSWVRYSVAVYVGLLLAGAAVLPDHADLEREAQAQPMTHIGRLYVQPLQPSHIHIHPSDPQAQEQPLPACLCDHSDNP